MGYVLVVERQTGDDFKAGYQEAVAEAVRFLVEVQGYGQNDGLCVSMSSHLQRHCESVTKGIYYVSIVYLNQCK